MGFDRLILTDASWASLPWGISRKGESDGCLDRDVKGIACRVEVMESRLRSEADTGHDLLRTLVEGLSLRGRRLKVTSAGDVIGGSEVRISSLDINGLDGDTDEGLEGTTELESRIIFGTRLLGDWVLRRSLYCSAVSQRGMMTRGTSRPLTVERDTGAGVSPPLRELV